MGEAKRRGSFEERKKQSLDERAARSAQWEREHPYRPPTKVERAIGAINSEMTRISMRTTSPYSR